MRRALSTAAWMLAFGAVVLPAVPALAGFGAVAYDAKTGRRGWSWNQATVQKAAEVALSQCGASDCKVLMKIGPKRCAALATTEDGKGWGASGRTSADAARLAALANCQKAKLGECIVRVSDCNK
jgi:serine/threonine-protein kinase